MIKIVSHTNESIVFLIGSKEVKYVILKERQTREERDFDNQKL